MQINSENDEVAMRANQKNLATGKNTTQTRRFGTTISVNTNVIQTKTQASKPTLASNLPSTTSSTFAPVRTASASGTAVEIPTDNVTPADTIGALDIDSGDR
eukprot:326459-Hanusia_phi.AAC.1